MKKIRFSNRSKIFLSLGAGCITTTALFTPLLCSSCSAESDPLLEFDKQFNISDYKNREFRDDCESKYETYLRDKKGIVDPEILRQKVEALHNDLNDIIKKSKNTSNSATITSNVMIDTMAENYGMKVSRQFDPSINFDTEITKFKQSCVDGIVRMMQEKKISSDQIKAKIDKFETNFSDLNKELGEKYDDKLSILYNLKHEAATLLDGISDELDQVAAASTFKKFFSRYQFVVNEDDIIKEKKYNLCWDQVIKNKKNGDNVAEMASKVFRLYDSNEKTYTDIKASDFEDGTIIAGHRVEPIWRGSIADIYSNHYSLSIEWRIIKKDNYDRYQTELAEKGASEIYNNTAATLASVNDQNEASKLTSMTDLLKFPNDKKTYQNYILPISPNFEKEKLQEAYGNGKIQLGWDDGQGGYGSRSNCGYEGYFGIEGKTDSVALSDKQIGAIGLTVGSTQTNSVTRLDALQEQVKSKLTAGADFDSLSLEEKFVDAVDLVSFSHVENDDLHQVNNKFYVAYKNSPYADKSDTEHTYAEFGDSNFTGMPLSTNLYDSLWKKFADSEREWKDNNLNDARNLKDRCHTQWNVNVICLSVLSGIMALCVAAIVFPGAPLKAAHLWAAGACGASIAANAGTIVFAKVVDNLASDFHDRIKKWHDDDDYKTYMIDRVKADYDRCLHSYDVFKSTPMSVVKPMIAYYSALQLQSEYKDCEESQSRNKVDPSEYSRITKLSYGSLAAFIVSAISSSVTLSMALRAAREHILDIVNESKKRAQEASAYAQTQAAMSQRFFNLRHGDTSTPPPSMRIFDNPDRLSPY